MKLSPLRKYYFNRIVAFIITVFCALTFNFVIPRLVPGDPISSLFASLQIRGQRAPGGDALIEAYRVRFGFDGDMLTQYIRYLTNIMQGDLGPSVLAFPKSVQDLLLNALPYTIVLIGSAALISWIVGNLLGLFIGWRRGGKLDSIITPICLVLNQIPYYFLGLMLVYAFAYTYRFFPKGGAYSVNVRPGLNLPFLVDFVHHLILPALGIIISSMAGWMIMMRAMLINVLGEDYLLLAEAKGMKNRTFFVRYVLRNALLPSITGLGMMMGFMLSGSMITEMVFNYPGVGTLLLRAVMINDYNTMQGIFLLNILGVLCANFLIDLLYPLIDPRIKHIEA